MRRAKNLLSDDELVAELTRRTGHRPMLVDDLAGVLDEAPLEHLVAGVRRRGRALLDVDPLGPDTVVGWLRAEAAAAAGDPEWAGGQDHPDALERVADQIDELLTAAEVYVGHVRSAGGGQVPGPGTSKLEALEAALDPVVPRGTVQERAIRRMLGDPPRTWPAPGDTDFSTADAVVSGRTCVSPRHRRGAGQSQTCDRPVDETREGDLCPEHQDEATAVGRDLIALLETIRYGRR